MGERSPEPRSALTAGHPVVLFDGVCHLCTAVVLFAIPRDSTSRLRFAPLQSGAARHILGAAVNLPEPLPDSFILVEGERISIRSAAALRLVRYLAMPWPLLSAFLIVPRPMRDWAYDAIARRRYRWFGTRDACLAPTPDISGRFLKVD
jgi:predicted DCC family thiol-disulfide oxidoreductase YuxK